LSFSYATPRGPCHHFSPLLTPSKITFFRFSHFLNSSLMKLPSPAPLATFMMGYQVRPHHGFVKPHSNRALAPLRGYQALLLMKLPRPAPLVIFTMGYQVRPHCGFHKSTQRATKSGYFAGFHLLPLGYQVRPQCSFKNTPHKGLPSPATLWVFILIFH
jgi:hypothetical protein